MTPTVSTSEKILDIAQSLVIAGGYNGFSYADIAVAIGIRKASIHHHFPAKADLVAALVERYRLQARTGLSHLREQVPHPADQLRAYLTYWKTCIGDASQPFCVCAMLAGEKDMLPKPVAAGVRAHFEHLAGWLTEILRAGSEQGLFRLTSCPQDEAQALMATVHGAMLSARALDNTQIFALVTDSQLERLLATAGR
ncbi:TetR/AcrR family transcriptional regulator [Rhizobium halophytocola]|uniref:TetR/AcrR family transcriptional repressor of nem operon n=1 Tax=Rhizobium halophytocola TaxID=735519 RepID=A0ABS4DW83_9HYPH|nr:TetR/AcrR family transcriptional regulator [Rhizobium halophytocola]MBP1849961.1 TetR/AcrR family transcriptional repressor of nem operon [Rhizobium halophytocola]